MADCIYEHVLSAVIHPIHDPVITHAYPQKALASLEGFCVGRARINTKPIECGEDAALIGGMNVLEHLLGPS